MIMAFTWWEAALVALYYWFCWWDFSHPVSGVAWAQDCVWVGVIMGLIFGDVQMGLVIGGTLGLTFICALPVGANLPVDYAAATMAAVPMAIRFGWSAGMAICVSVFFGIMGAKLDGVRRVKASRFHKMAESHIAQRKYQLLGWDAVIAPVLYQFVLRAVPMFLAMYFGGTVLYHAAALLPEQVIRAFEIAGHLLPGLGLALCLNTVGRVQMFPLFVIGFFMYSLVGGSTLVYMVIGLCLALLVIRLNSSGQGVGVDKALLNSKIEDSVLSTRDHFGGFARFMFMHRNAQAMDTFYGTGMVYSYRNVLRKIYKNDDDAYQEAMERHLEPFIPEVVWGSAILGIVVKKEEELAVGEGDGAAISALKTSLMGPVAGFGDQVNYMVFWNLLKMTFYPLAAAGSFLGMLTPIILHPVLEVIGWKAYKAGYSKGTSAIISFLKSNLKNNILTGASIMSSFLLGAICSAHTSLQIAIPGVQSVLDTFLPGIVPFAAVCGGYVFLRKGGKFLPMMVYAIVLIVVFAMIGIL